MEHNAVPTAASESLSQGTGRPARRRRYWRGFLAGLAATAILSAVMLAKNAVGMLPDINAIALLADIAHDLIRLPEMPAIGWVLHVLIGGLAWGFLFVILEPWLPGGRHTWIKGASFSLLAWVAMMLVFMPLAGASIFGLGLGAAAPVATLALHLIYGAVLGIVYRLLIRTPPDREM